MTWIHKYRWWLAALAGIIAIALAIDFFSYPTVSAVGGRSFNKGENGLWLRYLWYFGRKSPAESDSMVQLLKREQIRYAFFHVRDMKADGTLTYAYADKARKLTDFVHAQAPGVKVIAWIYVGSNVVDVTNKKILDQAVSQAKWLTTDCGFDGIQWDYEFAPNGGTALLQLLDATREAMPGTFVSVATPMWYPGTLWGWNDEYFRKVAQRCDQIAVMCYDSFFYLPRGYVWLLGQQAVHVLNAVAEGNQRCKVLLGVPTYDKGTAGHCDQSETISMALKGIREGLSQPKIRLEAFDGVAPFAEYTTTQDEWQVYEKWWLDAK